MVRKIVPMMIVVAMLITSFVVFGSVKAGAEDAVNISASEFGVANSEVADSYTVKGISFKFEKGTGSNDPKYYDSGSAVRTYAGNTMTISAEGAITKIVFTIDTAKTGTATASTGEYNAETLTWEG
ncbi:MAG: hypothetical protein J5950_05970, partial [Clostridia bacterium]|nr:hypothetical protein [Clostridia bacterium]